MGTKNDSKYGLERFTPQEMLEVIGIMTATAEAQNLVVRNVDEARQTRGWLVPYLFAFDWVTNKRWTHWCQILNNQSIENAGPIPQIKFAHSPLAPECKHAMKMLENCLKHQDSTAEHFGDFLLWGLGGTKDECTMSDKLFKHYYETFDLFLVLDNPTDYLSYVLSNQIGNSKRSNSGYYPTPIPVAELMSALAGSTNKDTVDDPCVGCGALLLPQSNYCYRASGTDINPTAIKFCKIQMAWYAPWFYMPGENIKGLDC